MPTSGTASATTLWYAEPGALEHRTYQQLYDNDMKLIMLRQDKVPIQGKRLFTEYGKKTDVTFKLGDIGGPLDLPEKSEDLDDLPRTQPPIGFSITFTPVNYRQSIRVTEDMLDVDKFGKITSMMNGLPMAGKRLMEYAFADVFNNGFATYTVADGMYAYDSARPQPDANVTTWSNLETAGALTHGRLSTARLNLRKTVDAKGHKSPKKLALLQVVPDLEEKAIEIRKAEKMPENALNQPNWLWKAFDIFVHDWLTSTTAWFVHSEETNPSEKGFFLITRFPMAVRPLAAGDMTTGTVWGRYLKMAFDYGAGVPRASRGNAGA
jgi:hypothetical protein